MNEKSKNILLGVLIVGIISMTVAYAALSTRLSITGTASVAETKWNIHFQNWELDTNDAVTYDNNTHQNTAVYPSVSQLSQTLQPNVTKVDNLNVTLKQPGDYARYTFEIINEGTIDASLANFSAPMTCTSGNGGDSEYVNSLDPEATMYLRNDGSRLEVCVVSGGGTVCMTSLSNVSGYSEDYYSDFEDVSTETYDITTTAGLTETGLKGYTLAKATEMLDKTLLRAMLTATT